MLAQFRRAEKDGCPRFPIAEYNEKRRFIMAEHALFLGIIVLYRLDFIEPSRHKLFVFIEPSVYTFFSSVVIDELGSSESSKFPEVRSFRAEQELILGKKLMAGLGSISPSPIN